MSQSRNDPESDPGRVDDVVGSQRPVREHDRQPATVAARRDQDHGPLVVGLLVGLVLLGALVAFAVALPRAQETALSLPDRLPGGWVAADDLEGDDERLAGVGEAVDGANGLLDEVYDHDTVVRSYVDEDVTRFVTVILFEAEGGAFVPQGLPGPDRTDQRLSRDGDAVCIEYVDPAGDPSGPPRFTSCQAGSGGVTAQVGGPGLAVEDVAELARTVVDELD